MNKFRRIGAMVAATVAATGMAMTVATAPAVAKPKDNGPTAVWPFLKAQDEQTVRPHSVWFKTNRTACNFKLMVNDVPGVEVWYPGFKPFTLLSEDDTLWTGELDYATFFVKTSPTFQSSWRYLPAHVWYDNCKWGPKKRVSHKWITFILPVRNTGPSV